MTSEYSYSNEQLEKLQYLLAKYRFSKLSEEEYNELKYIVSIWAPSVNTDEEIIKVGILTVGVYSLVKLLLSIN